MLFNSKLSVQKNIQVQFEIDEILTYAEASKIVFSPTSF